jgi:hypothetical protein
MLPSLWLTSAASTGSTIFAEIVGGCTRTSVCDLYFAGKTLDTPYPSGGPTIAMIVINTHRLRSMAI